MFNYGTGSLLGGQYNRPTSPALGDLANNMMVKGVPFTGSAPPQQYFPPPNLNYLSSNNPQGAYYQPTVGGSGKFGGSPPVSSGTFGPSPPSSSTVTAIPGPTQQMGGAAPVPANPTQAETPPNPAFVAGGTPSSGQTSINNPTQGLSQNQLLTAGLYAAMPGGQSSSLLNSTFRGPNASAVNHVFNTAAGMPYQVLMGALLSGKDPMSDPNITKYGITPDMVAQAKSVMQQHGITPESYQAAQQSEMQQNANPSQQPWSRG